MFKAADDQGVGEQQEQGGLTRSFARQLNYNTFLNLKDTPEHRALLDRALRELIPANFNKDETTDALKLVGGLQDPKTYKPDENGYIFTVAGENLDDPEKAVIKGLCVGTYFANSGTGALWYLVTDESHRGQGIGRHLTIKSAEGIREHAAQRGADVNSIFAHIHDPRLGFDPEDTYNAEDRVKFYSKINAVSIPIDFQDPYQIKDGGETYPYLLIAVPVPGKEFPPAKENIAGHIHDYWEHYGYENPEQYPEYQQLIGRVEELGAIPPLRPEEYLYPPDSQPSASWDKEHS